MKPVAFSRVFVRRTFDLDVVPATALARLAADSRYILYVNGAEVSRGPIRSQPKRMHFDLVDIAGQLQHGKNVVAVLLTYYGQANSIWYPAAASGRLGSDAGLLFEAEVGDFNLISDTSWRYQRARSWSLFPPGQVDSVPREIIDADQMPVGWSGVNFDDSSWETLDILSAEHIGGLGRARPPVAPYGQLLSHSLAPPSGMVVEPVCAAAHDVPAITEIDEDTPGMVVAHVLQVAKTEPAHCSLPLHWSGQQGRWAYAELDFGRVVAGYVRISLVAPRGTVIDLHFRDRPLLSGDNAPDSAEGLRYVARGHKDDYESVELAGLRYIYLVARVPEGLTLDISSITVRESVYPWSGRASFTSNDSELNNLYMAGVRTAQLNSFDAFTDCPTRELRSWVGDGVVHQMVHFTTNSDWNLALRYIELANSPRPDGILPMSVAGDIEHDAGFTIPDYSLHWIHAVHNVFMYLGIEAARPHLATAERILHWFAAFVDEHGTLNEIPEWNLADWSSIFTNERTSIVTALWGRALREFAEMSTAAGNNGNAAWAHRLWSAAAEGFEDFWDDRRGTYVDHVVAGVRQPAASQAAGAAAIVSGFAPSHRWNRIAEVISNPETLVVRSWIGGHSGEYDEQRIQAQKRGIQIPDWDVGREVVRAQPFFSYVVHDALAHASRQDLIVSALRSWTQFLTDGYDTFGECWGWGTPAHGWSSTPARDLVQHVAGIYPKEPGFLTAMIQPRPGALTHLDVTAPTPHGEIHLLFEHDELTVTSPIPFCLSVQGQEPINLGTGTHRMKLLRPQLTGVAQT